MIKPDTKSDLDRYANFCISTGSFLNAVLFNDLMGAMARADEENRRDIFDICQYIRDNLPVSCYGSPEAVKKWLWRKSEG